MRTINQKTVRTIVAQTIQFCKKLLLVTILTCFALSISSTFLQAQQDLYIKDFPPDDGTELIILKSTNYSSSEDIWVLTSPDPNYSPVPFPTGSPTWTPQPHQNPEFRDPVKFTVPNWVYVRVTNRGNQASLGTDQLKVYWSKGTTGTSWPAHWDDHVISNLLHAEEITKTRKNAAEVSQADRKTISVRYYE